MTVDIVLLINSGNEFCLFQGTKSLILYSLQTPVKYLAAKDFEAQFERWPQPLSWCSSQADSWELRYFAFKSVIGTEMEFLFHLYAFTDQNRLLSLSLLLITVPGPSFPWIVGSSNPLFKWFYDYSYF